jgi:hypothetical protein
MTMAEPAFAAVHWSVIIVMVGAAVIGVARSLK